MSSNNDHPMVRFLFAILQQECIKSVMKNVDWNLVAHNPILPQDISNGHAARMRYSRFRASLLGIEPQRRNRIAKNKVTKLRKELHRLKKEKRDSIKPDADATPDNAPIASIATPTSTKNEPFVKEEPHQQQQPPHIDANIAVTDIHTLPSTTSESQLQFYKPYMSPPSDNHTDLFTHVYGLPHVASPVGNIAPHEPMFDYTASATGHCAYEQTSWQPSPSYSPYTLTYEVENFSTPAPFSDHQHVAHPEGFGIVPSPMPTVIHTQDFVKHEEADTRLF